MILMAIAAKVPADATKGTAELNATVNVNFPDIDKDPKAAMIEAIAAYGEKAILTNARANFVVTLQSNIRAGLKKGEAVSAMQARLKDAKMGVAQAGVKVDAEQAFMAKFATATKEEKAAMLDKLKGLASK
jgi:hypothetical protein